MYLSVTCTFQDPYLYKTRLPAFVLFIKFHGFDWVLAISTGKIQTKLPKGFLYHVLLQMNGKAIPLQTWTVPEAYRRMRLPDFKTIGT